MNKNFDNFEEFTEINDFNNESDKRYKFETLLEKNLKQEETRVLTVKEYICYTVLFACSVQYSDL